MNSSGDAMTLDVQAIRARADASSPGPWAADESFHVDDTTTVSWVNGPEWWHDGYIESDADAAFIAAARTDVPALLDAVERLAFEVWSGTQRCYECDVLVRTECDRCQAAYAYLTELGFGDKMSEWT